MKLNQTCYLTLISTLILGACMKKEPLPAEIYQTDANGNKLTLLTQEVGETPDSKIVLQPNTRFQTITGFGGSFTEASASLLNRLGDANRKKIIDAYFGPGGARYSLTRTHMNSCDFSLGQYSYAPVEGDLQLDHFTIEEDREDIIPMIKEAMSASEEGFKILASPWTAPPWMKDNKDWRGGKLLPEYYETWALFFSKYVEAYRKEGIEIWGFTVENEPLGNDNNTRVISGVIIQELVYSSVKIFMLYRYSCSWVVLG